jgi:hypothetical protein
MLNCRPDGGLLAAEDMAIFIAFKNFKIYI